MIGNVRGRQNWFFKMARLAEAGDPDMHYSKIIAADAVAAGVISAQEVDDARRILPEQVFRELYEAIPSDDGGNPFGLSAIKHCIKPLSKLAPKWWGWDLAKKNDWCVGIGLDINGDVAAFHRWQKPWMETIELIKSITGTGCPAYADSTGVGDPIVEAIQRTHPNIEGYHFTAPSKQQLMEGLAVAIQQEAVGYPDGPIVVELEQFEYEYTRTGCRYSAPEGLHDDCVCALALAQRRRALPSVGDNILQYWAQRDAEEKAKQAKV